MSDLLPYQYVTLRCVPRVEREEFVNVGVVLFCEADDVLDCAWILDEPRLTALAPGLDIVTLEASLRALRDVCAGRGGSGRPDLSRPGARFGWIAAPRSTTLQPGPRHGGLTADPRAELHRLVADLAGPPQAC